MNPKSVVHLKNMKNILSIIERKTEPVLYNFLSLGPTKYNNKGGKAKCVLFSAALGCGAVFTPIFPPAALLFILPAAMGAYTVKYTSDEKKLKSGKNLKAHSLAKSGLDIQMSSKQLKKYISMMEYVFTTDEAFFNRSKEVLAAYIEGESKILISALCEYNNLKAKSENKNDTELKKLNILANKLISEKESFFEKNNLHGKSKPVEIPPIEEVFSEFFTETEKI